MIIGSTIYTLMDLGLNPFLTGANNLNDRLDVVGQAKSYGQYFAFVYDTLANELRTPFGYPSAGPHDPTFHDGVRGSFTAGSEEGEPGPVELDLVLQRVVFGEPQRLVLAGEIRQPSGERGSVLVEPKVEVLIDQPQEAQMVIRGTYQPDEEGKVVIERESSRFLGRPGVVRVELRIAPRP